MPEFTVKDFNRASFPALYCCADDASKSAQKWYLFWVGMNLLALFVGSLAGSFNIAGVESKRALQILASVMFSLGVGITILLAFRRWDKIWYAGRAVAESAKSLSWKFVCGADPFPIQLESKEAVIGFTGTLQELLTENKQLAIMLNGPEAIGEQVTEYMLQLRRAHTGVKKDVYLSQRVNQQQLWYAQKAADNRTARNRWFGILVAFQVAAAGAAVVLAINPELPWKAAAIFSTLASITVAWGQIKRYQELAQAYGLTAQELSIIAARAKCVETVEELSRFVNDAETAISREHSMWVARRETK